MHPEFLTVARSALVTALVALAACSDAEGGRTIAFEHAAIVNGELSDETDDEVVEISARISDTFTGVCTGTLVAPDIVLTALHCVSLRDDPNGVFTCSPDGTLSSSTPGAGELGPPIAGEDVQVFFGAAHDAEPDAYGVRIFGSGSTQVCRGDIAAVVLDRPLGEDIAPMRFGRSVTLGERMRVVGYGEDEAGMGGDRRFRAGRRVLAIGAVGSDPGTGRTPPNTFELDEGGCHGDSGGPALSEETGAITGVYSLVRAPSCTSVGVRNTCTLVSPFESMIRRAFEFAGREPLVEEGGGTGGMTTTGGSGGSGGSGAFGEGSGSREDPSCACRTAGRRPLASHGLLGVAFAMVAAARRRTRSRKTHALWFHS